VFQYKNNLKKKGAYLRERDYLTGRFKKGQQLLQCRQGERRHAPASYDVEHMFYHMSGIQKGD